MEIGLLIGFVSATVAAVTLYFRFKQEQRDKEKHAIELARERDRLAEMERKHHQEESERQRAASGSLDVAVDFQHDCGATVFAKITAKNTRISDDEINAVVLETHPTTEWKVLVPDLAPGVPIQATAWPQWTNSFPLRVSANSAITFWISGYADMGVKEHKAEAVLGKIFVFNIRATSGDVKRDTKMRKRT